MARLGIVCNQAHISIRYIQNVKCADWYPSKQNTLLNSKVLWVRKWETFEVCEWYFEASRFRHGMQKAEPKV